MANPQAHATLPQFTRDDLYKNLHAMLWPSVDDLTKEEEPTAGTLRNCIGTMTPDDRWLADTLEVEDLDDLNEDDGDEIRHIDLTAHPVLAIDQVGLEFGQHHTNPTFVVRREYNLFMEHAIARVRNPLDESYRARFFVTGQPGIGKTFGCYHFLFCLLASGQSVFFIESPTSIYYFSGDGVQKTSKELDRNAQIIAALKASWVLIDTDDNSGWAPHWIFKYAQCVIWTSSPLELRMKEFVKRFGAEVWYMKPWSTKEIAAVTCILSFTSVSKPR
ncbi:hypothetical protein C8R46DRAFT_1076792 [Mycena filopes]|nr:hypothetical protein C8R46DRAFT_1076792 [Mycena filopes]